MPQTLTQYEIILRLSRARRELLLRRIRCIGCTYVTTFPIKGNFRSLGLMGFFILPTDIINLLVDELQCG